MYLKFLSLSAVLWSRSWYSAHTLLVFSTATEGHPLLRIAGITAEGSSTIPAHHHVRGEAKRILTRVAFAPIFFYFLWVPLVSEKWKERASFPAPEIAGIPSMLCRAVSFVSTLLPYFGYFIVTASFCLLGIPTLALLFLRFGQNNDEVLYIFRACIRVLGSRLSVVTVNVRSVLSLLDTLTSWCQKQLLFLVAKPNSLGSHKYLYEHKLRVLNEGAFRTWTVSTFEPVN